MRRINFTLDTGFPSNVCFEPIEKEKVLSLLTFDAIPTKKEIRERAISLAIIAKESGADEAVINGTPYLMSSLEIELKRVGVTPVYSICTRKLVDINPDGFYTYRHNFLGFLKM